jgi:hypothetical protein
MVLVSGFFYKGCQKEIGEKIGCLKKLALQRNEWVDSLQMYQLIVGYRPQTPAL